MTPEDQIRDGQVTRSAADVYQEFFVPALFGQWPPHVLDAAGVAPGQRVLDVACGTGILACAAAERVGPSGSVVGLDPNAGMLDVARRDAPQIEWRSGRAESLPFGDSSFDAVLSQFGLMFFEDRPAAVREMWRVLRPGGRLAVAVWAELELSPGYAALAGLLARLFGDEVAAELHAPFVLGQARRLSELFAQAGVADPKIATLPGSARFASIEAWMHTDIRGWTLADRLDDAQYARLLAAAQKELLPFVNAGGSVSFAAPAHIATATRPR